MRKRDDERLSGFKDGAFPTTHWTAIFDARSPDEHCRETALEDLSRRYWKPVYCYLRARGCDDEAAKDLTQDFFHEVVLGRGIFERADRTRARFRTFLLKVLERYVISAHRVRKAKRRAAPGGWIRWEDINWSSVVNLARSGTPVEIFDYAWASSLLDEVLSEVAAECRQQNKSAYWEVFRERILIPTMTGEESPSVEMVCSKCGIPDKAKVVKMTFAVRSRVRLVLRRHVRDLVSSEAEVDDEIRYLAEVFSAPGGMAEENLRIWY